MELAVNEVFGYGSVPIDLVNENRQAFVDVMRKHKWHAIKGTMNVAFIRDRPHIELEFGESLDKKEVKKLLKEQQKHAAVENSLST